MDNNRMEPLLRVENLRMYFGGSGGFFGSGKTVKAVDHVSFSLGSGETFGLVGESGCGKTTTGKCILRLLRPTGGKILYDGADISSLNERQMAPYRRQIQMIFQDPYGSLDPRQSVFAILKEAVTEDGKVRTRAETEARVRELLELVELNEQLADRYPHEMSGGQRQRLGIARALACEPRLIVCDEPVSALDVSIQAQIINLFQKLQRELGIAYVFIAHDLAVVRHIAHNIGVMYLGHLVEVFEAEALYTRAVHPYTQALLSAVPTTNYQTERQRKSILLRGEVPSPMNVPTGCPFHPRCPYATERCTQEVPSLREVEDRHLSACHHAENFL